MENTHHKGHTSKKWGLAIIGAIELILGVIALSIPFALGITSIWLLGCFMVIAALLRFYRMIRTWSEPRSRWWNLISGIIYALLGGATVFFPLPTLVSLTLFIGWFLICGGIFRLVTASVPGVIGRGWLIFNAIITLLLGITIVWTFPGSAEWFLGTLIACELIFSGCSMFFVAIGASTRSKSEQTF